MFSDADRLAVLRAELAAAKQTASELEVQRDAVNATSTDAFKARHAVEEPLQAATAKSEEQASASQAASAELAIVNSSYTALRQLAAEGQDHVQRLKAALASAKAKADSAKANAADSQVALAQANSTIAWRDEQVADLLEAAQAQADGHVANNTIIEVENVALTPKVQELEQQGETT